MTAGYLLFSFAVLALKRDAVGDAFGDIFRGAFSVGSAAGGVLGFLTSRALRVGTMRGLLSNEAGCGTSPTAHAARGAHDPAAQGVWGIFEVLVDTLLLCTVTALVLLVSPEGGSALSEDGMLAVMRAYSSVLGGGTDLFFSVAVFCFGYATLLCWGGYGMESVRFLSSKKYWLALYLLLFGACILLGTRGASALVWSIADFCITAMTGINLCVLFLMRRRIRLETLTWARCAEKKGGEN
jgi:AGCS family alanine or glycine:cation symporter